MTDHEKLMQLLGPYPCDSNVPAPYGCLDRKYGECTEILKLSYCSLSHLADHLIANGVVILDLGSPLTYSKPNGDWGIEGVDLSTLPPKVYAALCRLKDLEHGG